MSSRKAFRASGITACLLIAGLGASVPQASEPRRGAYSPPTVLRAGTIEHPDPHSGMEALVYIRACISIEGRVVSTDVEPRGFHSPRILRAALQYVRSMVFRPAAYGGVAAPDCIVMPIAFRLSDSPNGEALQGVTREFRRELERIVQLTEDGDSAAAHHRAESMLRDKVRTLYEYAVLHMTLANTYVRTKQFHQALESAHVATGRRGSTFPDLSPGEPLPPAAPHLYLLPEGIIIDLLKMRMKLSAAMGLTADALRAYYELASLRSPDEELTQQGKALEQKMRSGEQLIGRIVLGESGTWSHPLTRTSFTIAGFEGELTALRMRCDSTERELAFVAGVDWHVPASWRGCVLKMRGRPGTSFDVVEFEDSDAGRTAGTSSVVQ